MNSEIKKIELWVKGWVRAAVEMEKERRDRLRSYDYSKNQGTVDEMLKWACNNKKSRLTSGLVEQQRYFLKLRDKYLINGSKEQR